MTRQMRRVEAGREEPSDGDQISSPKKCQENPVESAETTMVWFSEHALGDRCRVAMPCRNRLLPAFLTRLRALCLSRPSVAEDDNDS